MKSGQNERLTQEEIEQLMAAVCANDVILAAKFNRGEQAVFRNYQATCTSNGIKPKISSEAGPRSKRDANGDASDAD